MAMTIYASLTYNGTPITGEVGVPNIGGIDVSQHHIEIHGYHHEVSQSVGDTHRAASNRVLGPIVFTKRVDAASAPLLQAWNVNGTIAGAFKFFRTVPGTRQAQMFHVVQVANARIMGVRTEMLNNLTPEGNTMPYLERVTLTYPVITVSNVPGQLETTIEWANL